MVPFPAELVTRCSATHLEGRDIDRIRVDWATVARELWTGRRHLPVGQLTFEEHAHG